VGSTEKQVESSIQSGWIPFVWPQQLAIRFQAGNSLEEEEEEEEEVLGVSNSVHN
jgi:hypothetical protein